MNIRTREVPANERQDARPCQPDPFFRASSTLLSRLAEAVDGHRIGKGVCFVARFFYDASDNGHRMYGPFASCEEAEEFWDANELDPEEFGIFGPFYTKEALRRASGEVKEVVIRFKDEDIEDIVLDGDTHDAVFWKPAAIEKFALPYYMSIGSLEECNDIAERAASVDVVAHKIGSGSSLLRGREAETKKQIGLYGLTTAPDKTVEESLLSGGIDR